MSQPSSKNVLRPLAAAFATCILATVSRATDYKVTAVGNLKTWAKAEFSVTGIPAVSNPFNPDVATVDATIVSPTGSRQTVPGFWYQEYARTLTAGQETLKITGTPGWRIRFTPTLAGAYSISVAVTLNGASAGSGKLSFKVASASPIGQPGYLQVESGARFFAASGHPVPLVGNNACWPDAGGTFNYDAWLKTMASNHENYTRVWMAPFGFGIEDASNELTNYQMDHAWQLDHVFADAEADNIYILLCLDYHGMFQVVKDYWGGNNYWPLNPYNQANGGPCSSQDDFFVLASARRLYEMRLRYLIARYGYSTSLFAWEFFNELDNVDQYLDRNHVASWFSAVGGWLHDHDPNRHLITTSYVVPDRPEVWNLPQIDFTQIHPYAWANPGTSIPATANTLQANYSKPVLVGEFGSDFTGWNRTKTDPYLRGFRQGIWGAAVGGTAGSAMSWWWDDLMTEGDLSYLSSLETVLKTTTWGAAGSWTPLTLSPIDELQALGPVLKEPATQTQISLDPNWGTNVPGALALTSTADGARGALMLNAFLQGSDHPDLRRPFKLIGYFGTKATFTVHVNSVSVAASLRFQIDGTTVSSQDIPNKDGLSVVNEEYNQDFSIAVPAGKHLIEVDNPGQDWIYLDYAKAVNFIPATYLQSPAGSGAYRQGEWVFYMENPVIQFPLNALTASIPPMTSSQITLQNMPPGSYSAKWYDPKTGKLISQTTTSAVAHVLELTVPKFTEDLFLDLKNPTLVTKWEVP